MQLQELSLIREALNVGPEDQSLWYYHQFLILNLVESTGRPTIAPRLAPEERVTYVVREIEDIRDLLQDYDDIKWIYEALMEYTLALAQLEEREPNVDERGEMKRWLAKLRKLDPMRSGRWDDVENEFGLQ
jgi:geranylgeranyl transferase type-2 subunit alpha